ncbi:Tiparp [Symbiodinium natans]|uniref:Poly [ADP-ribose] polymerase n=1 Tax=Symbiodinium natans TaxID=878477 RepID=A0A812L069_9DINO|nr:Tiparp [Symbiodinium natans]
MAAPEPEPCERNCGRPSFGRFRTCCTHCTGQDSSHSRDCDARHSGRDPDARSALPTWVRPESVPEGRCKEGCGRKAKPHLEFCCKSCPFLIAKYGKPGHDATCDIEDNEGQHPPWYWCAEQSTDPFHNEVEGHYVQELGTKLIRKSLPTRRVLKCLRVEDSILWEAYARRRAEVRRLRPPLMDLKPATYEELPYSALSTLDKTVNEVWLFHGTSEEAARAICTSHFRLPERAAHGSNFGKGVYFADRAIKSHEYTLKTKSGCRVIMLCRVVLGNILQLRGIDAKAHETVAGTEYTSVLGCADGTNREFIVFDVAQVYPEYVMFYCAEGGAILTASSAMLRVWSSVSRKGLAPTGTFFDVVGVKKSLWYAAEATEWQLRRHHLASEATGRKGRRLMWGVVPCCFDKWQVLGVDADSAAKTLDFSQRKRAYHCLALLHHPDKGGDDVVFKAIATAYKALTEALAVMPRLKKAAGGTWKDKLLARGKDMLPRPRRGSPACCLTHLGPHHGRAGGSTQGRGKKVWCAAGSCPKGSLARPSHLHDLWVKSPGHPAVGGFINDVAAISPFGLLTDDKVLYTSESAKMLAADDPDAKSKAMPSVVAMGPRRLSHGRLSISMFHKFAIASQHLNCRKEEEELDFVKDEDGGYLEKWQALHSFLRIAKAPAKTRGTPVHSEHGGVRCISLWPKPENREATPHVAATVSKDVLAVSKIGMDGVSLQVPAVWQQNDPHDGVGDVNAMQHETTNKIWTGDNGGNLRCWDVNASGKGIVSDFNSLPLPFRVY